MNAWVLVVGKGSFAKCYGLFQSYDMAVAWAKRNQFEEFEAFPVSTPEGM